MKHDLGPEPDPPGSSLAGALACLFALLAGGAGLALIGAMPAQRIAVLTAPILLGGAAYPLLLRATPVEPSALKVVLFAVLGSPFVLLVLVAIARLFLPLREALAASFFVVAFLQPLALGRPLRFERLGGAAWSAVILSAGLGAYLAWLLFAEPGGARQLTPGALRHAGLAQALLRPGPLENPWLAGTPGSWASAYHGLVALTSACLEVDVLRVQAGIAVVAAMSLPLGLYLLAAPLWQRALPCALAAPFALFGWNAAAGLASHAGPGAGEAQAWAERLSRFTPGAEAGALPYGLSAFLAVGPEGLAMGLAVAAWMAGAHALRHGERPWPALCVFFHLAAIAVDPRLGVIAGVSTLLAYLTLLPAVRSRAPLASMGPAWLAILLGGFGIVRLLPAGSAQYPEPAPWDRFPGATGPVAMALLIAAGPLLALALCRLLPLESGAESREPGAGGPANPRRGTIFWLVAFAVLMPGLGAAHELMGIGRVPVVPRPAADALRLASLPLGILAAGGFGSLLAAGMGGRVVAAALALALGFGGLRVSLHAHAAHRDLAWSSGPLLESGMQLNLRFVQPHDEALVDELVLLRDEERGPGPSPVLLCAYDAGAPYDAARGGTARFPQLAGLVANLPVFVEREREVDFGSKHGRQRDESWTDAATSRQGVRPELMNRLRRLDRRVVILVREVDRERTAIGEVGQPRGLELELERLGAARVKRGPQLTRLELAWNRARD